MTLLVIDIGGSAIKYGLWENKELHHTDEVPTPLTRGSFYDQLQEIKEKFTKEKTLKGVAISSPGDVDEESGSVNGVSFVPFLHLGPIIPQMEQQLNLPISMMNDADCAALAELRMGVAKNADNPLFLIIGSGLGIAFAKDGQVVSPTDAKQPELKDLVARSIKNLNNSNVSPVQIGRRVSLKKFKLPSSIDGKDVFKLAEADDPIAKKEVNKLYQSLAEVLLSLNLSYHPEFIALGGGVSQQEGFLENIQQALAETIDNQAGIAEWFKNFFTSSDKKESLQKEDFPIVKICQFKNQANLIGAALHFEEKYPEKA